jgi:two-component system response regulator AlgR
MTAVVPALNVLVVDDEPHAVRRLCLLCARLDGVHVTGTANDGHEGLRLLATLRPDILLLDIAMPGLDGMAVARAVADSEKPPAIVFVTAHDHFAAQAFDLAVADYLLKPVTQERLDRALKRIRPLASSVAAPGAAPAPASGRSRDLWVPSGGQLCRVPVATIDLVEAERDYVRLHVGTRSFLMSGTLTSLESRLNPDLFLRAHRSWIVRRSHVSAMKRVPSGGWVAVLSDGREIPIGRKFLPGMR